jgi:N-acetylneuraminic acid mutarotase
MKVFAVRLTLVASFFLAGHLDAQSFRDPLRIPTTQDPVSVFTGDVNDDGVPDLLYETWGNSTTPTTMNVFFGQSSGGYVAGPTINLPAGVGGCRPLDANRDGKLDLACLQLIDEYDVEVATLLGNGDGTFQAAIYSAPMQSQVGLDDFIGWIFTPVDVNSDGIPDLLVGDELDEWIFVLLGDGSGRFTVKSILGGYPGSGGSGFNANAGMSITVTDLNGDGKPDLAFSNGPTILLGNGDGTFQTPNTYTGTYFSCVYHDMDGDGHLDAVCANVVNGNELAILHGNADGSFNTTSLFTKTYIASDAPWPDYVQDLNGDGVADIVADSLDGLEVLMGEPGLKFAAPVHYAVGYPASNGQQSSQFADMNQDGHIDVVAGGPNGIYIGYGKGDGTFNASPAYEVAQDLGHVTVADFNGDGIPDIAASGDQSIELSLGNGDGTFKPYVTLANGDIDFSTGGRPGDAQIVHGDFRGNGKQDILAIGSPSIYVYNSYILFGNGDGTFAIPQLVPGSGVTLPYFDAMAVLDINKDGRDDVLTMHSGSIYSALSNGDGTFATVSTSLPANSSGGSPSFPAFADFNHDGKLDAAYGLSTSVQILKGHGDGTFDTTGVNLPIPSYMGTSPLISSAALVATGDFDGDGNPDIAALVEIDPQPTPWTNQILTVAYVYYGNGDGTFSPPVLAGAFNREYGAIFAADVNKDGLADLILQTYGAVGFLNAPSGDALGVLLSKPGRLFGPEVNYTGGQTESGLIIADFNGDGYPDLLSINSGFYLSRPGNTVTELLNLGAQTSGGLIPTSTALTSSSNPAMVGTSITFTATVSSFTSGKGAPAGSVTFADQTGIHTSVSLVASSSSAASATLTTSAIGIGSDVMSATYSGDTVFATNSANITQTVTGDSVKITFTATPNPAVSGQTVMLNAAVANPTGSSAAAPTGTISFSDGGSPLAGPIALTGGTATYSAIFSFPGLHTLAATYSGDPLHGAITATLNEQVLSSSPNPSEPKEWAWMGGSSAFRVGCNQVGICGQPGQYGTLGTPAAENAPGGRSAAPNWTDSGGNLWLFGGQGFDANNVEGYLNDLWEFNPATNQWTWMGGNSTVENNCAFPGSCGWPGVYGTLYLPAPGNIPGGRWGSATWTDRNGNFWLFGGYGYDAADNLGYLNDLWEFSPSASQWTWMGGDRVIPTQDVGPPGVYGTMGAPASGNTPGARMSAVSWVDNKGRFWLFSGLGFDGNDAEGNLNDLWEYDPSTKLWAWMGGNSTIGNNCAAFANCGRPGVYGTQGTPAPGNSPGGRQMANAWADSSGHFWLLGGVGFDSQGSWSALNDLWEFNASTGQWTWVGGSSTIAGNGLGQPSVYGTLGIPAPGNQPGGLYGSACWIDSNGNFWFFGGWFVAHLSEGEINDQWEFNPSTHEWSWWGGGQGDAAGIYGTLGIPAAGNFPGARIQAMAWTDSHGNPWLFGGGGWDINDIPGVLNDLWAYQPAPSVPSAAVPIFSPAAGSYATAQTVAISDTTLGAVIGYTTDGTAPNINSSVYSTPIAVSASETIKAIATATGYGNSAIATANYTITLPAAATPTFNIPAGNYNSPQSVTISDTTPGAVIYYTINDATPTASSNVYSIAIAVSTSETLKAIAMATGYSPSQVASAAYTITSTNEIGEWTWMGGSSTIGIGCTDLSQCGRSGVYGTLGTPAAGNIPGGRISPASWTDQNGNFWFFGGWGYDANGSGGELNDLWEFNPSTNQWAWMGGSSTTGIGCTTFDDCGWLGQYGTLGSPAAGNIPGSRYYSTTWVDEGGNLWLFGGYAFDANGNLSAINDLWEFSPSTKEWEWVSGDRIVNAPGVYGAQGTPAAGNVPGARWSASGWTDNTGNFWLFAGNGIEANGTYAYLNDLWKFNPSTKEWAWMAGSDTAPLNCALGDCIAPGVNGTLGVPATENTPECRYLAATWIDGGGNLWLFGGECPISNRMILLNDLWEFLSSSNEWAWMGGANTTGCTGDLPGIYGTLGAPAGSNIPGGRGAAATWTNGNGDFLLFGGAGIDGHGVEAALNDLWEFNPSTKDWTWVGGSSTGNQPGLYGTLDDPAAGNIPGGRYYPPSWIDGSGNLWLFGGLGLDANGDLGYLNDVWRYGPATSNLPVAATPTFSPSAGTYASAQSVTISDTTPGAVIYYTANGIKPTASSSVYSTPITISSTETIEAIATATGYSNSAVATAAYTITGSAVATTTTLAASSTSLTVGQTLTLAATVTPASGAVPAGTVTFFNGAVSLGTATLNSSGVATLALTPAAGSYSITASYGGSSADAPSASSPAVAVTVNAIATTIALIASPNTLSYGQTLTLTATVTPASGAAPTGTVTFSNGAVSLGTAALNGSGVATLTLIPAFGSYSITANYAGSASDAASTSAPVKVNVTASPTTITLSASTNPAPFGANVTFTATMGGSTATPVGSVSFYDGSTLLNTAALVSGVSNYSTSELSVGSHNITTIYAGATGFNGSTSNVVVEVISPADFSISASPNAQTVYTGEATSYSVTIAPGIGFTLPVALSCTQVPVNTTCSFSSATVSGGSGSTTLTVQTSAPSKAPSASALSAKVGIPVLAGLFLLFIPRRFRRFRKGWPIFLALLLSIVLAAAISGCSAPDPLSGGTPVGAQTITVTGVATNGSQTLTHATFVTLNVKSLF